MVKVLCSASTMVKIIVFVFSVVILVIPFLLIIYYIIASLCLKNVRGIRELHSKFFIGFQFFKSTIFNSDNDCRKVSKIRVCFQKVKSFFIRESHCSGNLSIYIRSVDLLKIIHILGCMIASRNNIIFVHNWNSFLYLTILL